MTGTSTLLAQRYRLLEPLGRGGMGTVWLARDEVLHRDVAVKEVVPPAGLNDSERADLRRRTLREARAAARLNHPNVVRVYDIVEGADWPWIVMEYVPARSLQQAVREDGPMTPAQVAAVGLAVLDALRAAHRAGVLHRDVKPANVLLADDGRVVLTDFGLATVPDEAAVTRPGLVLGSPSFISPERARGDPGGPGSDLWSLGATLYAALEGRAPFERSSAMATLTALATEPPPRTRRGGGRLRRLIDGLLDKEPESRMTAAEAERLLRTLVPPNRPVPAARPAPARPAQDHPAARRAPDHLADLAVVRSQTRAAQPDNSKIGGRGWRLGHVALALAGAVVTLALLPRDASAPTADGGVAPTSSSAPVLLTGPSPVQPTPGQSSPAQPGSTGFVLPAGWRTHRDPTGFAVAVPANWTVSRRGTIVYFADPASGRLLGVDQTSKPKRDPVADWEGQEDARVPAGDFPQYERIGIGRCAYFVACADWEFRYTRDGVRTHVNNRGVVISDRRAYGFWWSTSEAQWTVSRGHLDTVFRSFQPAA